MDYLEYFKKLENYNEKEKKSFNKKDLNNLKKCKNCDFINSIIYDYINYNKICSNCGMIYDDIIDESAEWRNYGYFDNKKIDNIRCGQPINYLLPKSSMSTTIGRGSKYNNVKRLQKWNQISSDERSEYEVFKKIDNLIENKKINKKIIDYAKLYYKILSKDILIRSKNKFIVACIVIASKNNNKPLDEKKLLKIFNITKSDLTKGLKIFSNIEKEKNLNINNNNIIIHDLIDLYGKQFNINETIIQITHLIYIRSLLINILKNTGEKSICSGLFYFISILFKLNLSKQHIISKINISEVTLNKTYKIFNKHIDILTLGFDKIKCIN